MIKKITIRDVANYDSEGMHFHMKLWFVLCKKVKVLI